jgi:hypothetical protein
MALERTFKNLNVLLHSLKDDLSALRITVVQDKPRRRNVALVKQIGDAIEIVRDRLKEALEAAAECQLALGYPLDIDRARRALTTCQERLNIVSHGFAADVMSCDRVKELTRLGQSRGGEWAAWMEVVLEALEQSRYLLEEANQALSLCWQELVERVGMMSVSVRATNVVGPGMVPGNR